MTVLLVLLFICIMISIDAIRQYKTRHVTNVNIPDDAFVHSWGITMADGGEKISKEKPHCICPSCGQEIKK